MAEQETRLAEISSQLEEVLESLSEEDKEQTTVKEGKDGFVNAEVGKAAKAFLKEQKDSKVKFEQESYEAKIIKANEYVLAEAAKPFLGIWGFKIIAIAALLSTASAINATLYGGANVSFMIARDGELPKMFERKIWNRATEGLFITAGLVILFTNLFDLGGISMLGSASFLVIYGAANLAHLRLYKETGANPFLIWASIIGCLGSFLIIVIYESQHSPITLFILIFVIK